MSITIPDISDAQMTSVVQEIDRDGFACVPNFIATEDLARMRGFVDDAVRQSNGEYAGLIGPEKVSGSGLDELGLSPKFRSTMQRIYERGTGRTGPKQDLYQLLRCLSGQTTRAHSFFYHYDSYVVTLLIPIHIPTHGSTGDLIMLPNLRRIRKYYLFNALDKVLLDNRVTQWGLRKLSQIGLIKMVRIKMVPGNAYIFWGYRSVHANEPSDPNQVRATALFHYANPHAKPKVAMVARARLALSPQR